LRLPGATGLDPERPSRKRAVPGVQHRQPSAGPARRRL